LRLDLVLAPDGFVYDQGIRSPQIRQRNILNSGVQL